MQVTAKNIPDKQTGLEHQIQNKEKTTIAKHKERREEMRKVSKIMAKEYVIELKEKHKKEIKELKYFGWMDILKYIRNDDEDELFKLKMNLFKSDIVKETTNSESLDKIRNAKTFVEVLEEYKKL